MPSRSSRLESKDLITGCIKLEKKYHPFNCHNVIFSGARNRSKTSLIEYLLLTLKKSCWFVAQIT
jgi:hypothetical protein